MLWVDECYEFPFFQEHWKRTAEAQETPRKSVS